MSRRLNIYECYSIQRQIEAKAEENDGELTDEEMQSIVLAQTSSIKSLAKLAGYVKHLEGFVSLAKNEMTRLKERKKVAENRVESIKRWLKPYLEKNGPITAGTHRLSTRKSQGVVLEDGFKNPGYGTTIPVFMPDKKAIKESIQAGVEVEGAILEDRISVQIK